LQDTIDIHEFIYQFAMLIGYVRVSTDDQKLNLQQDALRAAGCEQIFTDHISGVKAARPGLNSALERARAGDTLVVWRLDRLGRSLKDLIELTETLKGRSIGLHSLQESINTTSSSGQERISLVWSIGRV